MPSTSSSTSIPSCYYPRSDHPALHYRSSIPSSYLPDDEYCYLVKRHQRSRLQAHFAHHPCSSSSPSRDSFSYKTAYQEQGKLSREHRTRISEMAHATRAALGPSFDFTDKGYDRMQTTAKAIEKTRREEEEEQQEQQEQGGGKQKHRIPSRYLANLSEKYWDEDKKYRQDQYGLNGYSAPVLQQKTQLSSMQNSGTGVLPHPSPLSTPVKRERCDSGMGESSVYGPTPDLASAFSDDSSSEDEAPKRRFWGRKRRSRQAD